MSIFFQRLTHVLLCAALASPALISFQTEALYAQSSASLTGTILDPRGVALPGATVQVRNEATGTSQKTTSDAQGKYSVSLQPGVYSVTVEHAGYQTATQTDVAVVAGGADVH